MRHGLPLRILILGIGFFFAVNGLSMAVMFSALAFVSPSGAADEAVQPFHLSMLIGSGLGPLLIGILVLVFSARLERLLLGDVADRPVEGLATLSSARCASLLLRLLGLYLACSHLTELVSTGAQAARASGETVPVTDHQILAEFAAHLVGLVFAGLLCFRTGFFVRFLLAK